MAKRYDLPRIKPDREPSYLNSEMVDDALVGNVIGSLIMWPLVQSKKIAMAGTALGVISGALRGKSRMEHEKREGRVVEDPTYWNNGTTLGALGGLVTLEAAELLEKPGKPIKIRGLLVATTIGGAVLGSILGKRRMQQEYDQVVALKQATLSMPQAMPVGLVHTSQNGAGGVHIYADTANDQGTLIDSPAAEPKR